MSKVHKSIHPIYKPEKERKVDRRKALIDERNKLLDDAYKIKVRVEEITEALKKEEPTKLDVSEHAIKRFQQRIINVRLSVVRTILNDKELLKKYKKYGEGRYVLGDYPDVVAVVSNWTVVTCYSKSNHIAKMWHLRAYMRYYIDEVAERIVNGSQTKILSFSKFRRRFYK